MDNQLKQSTLDFHEFPVPGGIRASLTRPLTTQCDLALAYLPSVVVPCLEIEKGPLAAYKYTTRDNLVAVISNGIAVLGLGNIDALADEPVMEGRGVLLRKFARIDVFDIEVDELGPNKFISVAAVLEPTFSGINLEDTKAPECFYIERELRERMNIPVLHSDRHGMAIISTAAILNGLRAAKKNISDVCMVVFGAGTAVITYMNLLVAPGVQKHDIVVRDSKGVTYKDHEPDMAETKTAYVVADDGRCTLDDVIDGADIFLDCSDPKVLTQEVVKKMVRAPITLAFTNPGSEILPPLAKEVRSDATIRTGRSNYPNQVNSVLCLPLIFHGALDISATVTNEEMKLAAVHAIAELAHAEQSKAVAFAYGDRDLSFGLKYIIPKPFDPHLIVKIVPAVAKIAMDSGVAMCPIVDFDTYTDELTEFVYKTNLLMKPIFSLAHKAPKCVVLTEGEEVHVLRVIQELITLGPAKPTLIGRPSVAGIRIQKLGLQIKASVDFEIVNNESDPRFKEYWSKHYQIMKRHGITQEQAQRVVVASTTAIGAIMVQRDEAGAMVCGTIGDYHEHFSVVEEVLGHRDDVHTVGATNALLLPSGNTFIAGTYVNDNPTSEQPAEIAMMATEIMRRFGIEPKVVLLSHPNSGFSNCPSASKMRDALELIKVRASELMIDGGIRGGAALTEDIRNDHMPDSPLRDSANILVMPNMEVARTSYNLPRVFSSEDVMAGPMLIGVTRPAHVLTPITSVRRIVNMMAPAVVEA